MEGSVWLCSVEFKSLRTPEECMHTCAYVDLELTYPLCHCRVQGLTGPQKSYLINIKHLMRPWGASFRQT